MDEKIIGKGGFMLVYKFWDGKEFKACKMLKTKQETKNNEKMIPNEFFILNPIRHRNIAIVYEIQSKKMVMEHINGVDLLKYKSKFEYEGILNIMKQLAKAISHLHSQNIVHRDIKLANVMIDCFENVKLIDFGSSYLKGTDFILPNTGTPNYVAQELIVHATIDEEIRVLKAADVYALGILFYVLVHSCFPFPQHFKTVKELYKYNLHTPDEKSENQKFGSIINQMIRKDWQQRLNIYDVKNILNLIE